MALIAYHASQEQFSPSHLLQLAILAEQAGFDAIHSSDHFHPWSKRQGQSGFTFSWIAAAMQATRIPFSMVCSPGQRLHVAIVAQAIATIAEMFPERFSIELGSGEALNESITGHEWPNRQTRNERLQQCAKIIRQLLAGDNVNFNGHVQVRNAKLYSLPLVSPPLFGCALSKEVSGWLASWADGLLTIAGDPAETKQNLEAFRKNGGEGKPVFLQFAFSYGRDHKEALMSAWDQWRTNLIPAHYLSLLSTPEEFEEMSKDILPEQVAESLPVYDSIGQLEAAITGIEEEFRPDRIILHNVNHFQEDFITDISERFLKKRKRAVMR